MRSLSPLPLLAIALGCEATVVVPPPAPPPPAPPVGPPVATFAGGAWGTFRSERFELKLALPEGHTWRIDDHGGPWLSATHPPSSSALLVRTWTEEGRVHRRRCEERARLWKKLPEREGAEMIQQRSIDAPAGFDTFVEVGVVPEKPPKGGAPPPSPAIAAFAMAFGGRGHRCFAYVYTTRAAGPGAESIVGERLATMVERSLGGAVLESELTPKIPHAPEPPR
jgi:hypothetical protein